MLKFPSDKINDTKSALFFLLQARTHDICTSWSYPNTDLVINFLNPENRSFTNILWEHQQKTFVTLSRFWPLRVWGSLSESVKKGQFMTKIFFSDVV